MCPLPRFPGPARTVLLGLPLLWMATAAMAQSPVPVVVAIDTSRSLGAGELRAATDQIADVLRQLPADTPAGLLAFDDETDWKVPLPGTPADVVAALPDLRPSGRFTLLHDALFVASRDLSDGGVVIVATDGRDENSATTVEDIGRRAETQGVRILTLGIGRPLQERALRRLALLTEGSHLGHSSSTTSSEISRILGETRALVEETRRTTRSQAAPVAAAPPPPVVAQPPPPTETTSQPPRSPGDWLWGLVAAAALGVALVLSFLLLRNQGRPRMTTSSAIYCDRCGSEIESEGADCPHCRSADLRRDLLERDVALRREIWEITGETAIVEDPSLAENLEKTKVLAEQHVLILRARGEETRTFVLNPTKAFSVGREEDPGNTLALLDPALSAHHFRVVPSNGHYHLLDLGSTNGTWADGERVDHPRTLRPGDRFRAGRIEFEFQTHLPAF